MKTEKQKIKWSVRTDDMTGYIENPKESINLELISELGKVTRYKVKCKVSYIFTI